MSFVSAIFFRNPGFYSSLDTFRDILCSFRECNVGQCRLPYVHHSEERKEIAGAILKEHWATKEFTRIDQTHPYFDDANVAQMDYVRQRYLFDIWTCFLCAIQDMYGSTEFLLQYPSQRSLDLVLRLGSHCECTDGFGGPYCSGCPIWVMFIIINKY